MNLPIKLASFSALSRGARLSDQQEAALDYVLVAVLPAVAAAYPTVIVSSAYRSAAKQALLYAAWVARRGPRAARPGTSFHELRKHPGGTTWAVDLRLPGRAPKDWIGGLRLALEEKNCKYHTAATERTWIHLQGVYGGGTAHNPGLRATW